MAGPFTTPVADSVPMDTDISRTSAVTEDLQSFINTLCPVSRSQQPTFLANGEVDFIEIFESATQIVANRRFRVDMTYDSILNPVTEIWKIYDPLDGITILRTVTLTHTWLSAEITKTEMATT